MSTAPPVLPVFVPSVLLGESSASQSPPARVPAQPTLSERDAFAHVIEAAPIAMVLMRQDGRIEIANRQAERLFGYDHAQMRDVRLEMLMPERFRVRHIHLRANFLTDAVPRGMGEGAELFGLRRDGSEFRIEVGLNPIRIDGMPMVLANVVDISHRWEFEQTGRDLRQSNADLEQSNADLEQSNADLEEFAYAASHDLKAPLRAISHLVHWIAEDVEATASPETTENLRLLRGRLSRLQKLLDGLLAYSRIRHTQNAAEIVDVNELAEDVVAMLAPPPGFVVDIEPNMPRLRTYRAPLQVVLENLVGNALKHHDRAEGRIGIFMKLEGGVAEFRVTDDGPGIPQRFHEKIFQIFQTLASRDDVEASGIGLAIVRKRVNANGGRVWVECNPSPRGSSFVFTWPEAPACSAMP